MKTRKFLGNLTYILLDYLAAIIAWALLWGFRRIEIEEATFGWNIFNDNNFWIGILVIPIGWLVLYAITDNYEDIYKMSRVSVFFRTIFVGIVGIVFLFFVIILNDKIRNYLDYYSILAGFSIAHIGVTLLFRMIVLSIANYNIKKGNVGYNTLFIGSKEKAETLIKNIEPSKQNWGHIISGYIGSQNDNIDYPLLGSYDDIRTVIKQAAIEDVMIVLERDELALLPKILDQVSPFGASVKISPEMYNIQMGNVKMSHVLGVPLIDLYPRIMPTWQFFLKRALDIAVGATMLLLLSPLYLFAAIKVKLSSKGPIFFRQERLGKGGHPFMIFKFRSMRLDAEDAGPQLSKDDDPRVTPWGKIMRKYRIDEIPQFYNVLIGDMSLVGPRPERQFYIDQIVDKAPNWKQLLRVRPGITSWGQVKYGYASNIEEMVQRLKYDILYIENMSLSLDITIMLHTVMVLVKGKGK